MLLKHAMGWDLQVPMRSGSGGAQYIDIALTDGRRSSSSPPRYRQSVLTRLHEVRPRGQLAEQACSSRPGNLGHSFNVLQLSLCRTLLMWCSCQQPLRTRY